MAITSADLADYPDKLCCIVSEVVGEEVDEKVVDKKVEDDDGLTKAVVHGSSSGVAFCNNDDSGGVALGDSSSSNSTRKPFLRVCNVIVPKLSPTTTTEAVRDASAVSSISDESALRKKQSALRQELVKDMVAGSAKLDTKAGASASASSVAAAASSFAFTGTGDCAAALLLAWNDILGDNQVSDRMMM